MKTKQRYRRFMQENLFDHIRLNLADEIESLLETLRRESCTA